MTNYGPFQPYNIYSFFIGANPITTVNPISIFPKIHKQTLISPFTYILGDVTIQKNVFLGPFVSIRADEGSPFFIGMDSNLQDGVIFHGLKDQYVEVNRKRYSIYVGNRVSCTHGAIIHGPCLIEDDVFIGFSSTVFHAKIGRGSYISSQAVVTNGVTIKPESFVPPGANIDSQEKADSLSKVPKDREQFAKEVQRVNKEFPAAYSRYFGLTRCSCGLSCDMQI